jgi:hypothetical protein
MKTIITLTTVMALLAPTAATAFGIGGFYMVSVPFARVEYVSYVYTYLERAETSAFGFGGKAWHNFTPLLGVEGFFSYVPEYRAGSELISALAAGGGFRINTTMGSLEPYGSVGAGFYGIAAHGAHPTSGALSFGIVDPPSTDFGLYVGIGIMTPIAGPVKFDFNPTYSAVFADGVVHFIDVRFGAAFTI